MRLENSEIIKNTLRKIYPFILLFSMSVFSYGGIFPGGGFQAGVVAGTIIIVYKILIYKEEFDKFFYNFIEFLGFTLMVMFLFGGLFFNTYYFDLFYKVQTESNILSNVYIWLFNLAIYLEVAGSIVIIFKYFYNMEEKDV